MEQRLSLITLGVADLARSEAFYRGLGWTPAQHDDNIVFFQLNGFVLALHPGRMLAEDAELPNAGPGSEAWGDGAAFRGITLAYNVRSKDEVHEVIERAREAGGRVSKEPRETSWGGYGAYFLDPDGHPWEVAFNPFSTLDERGDFIVTPDGS